MESSIADNAGNPAPVSKKIFHIAGISTAVHGLEELPKGTLEVGCLWLLHPRLADHTTMEPVASTVIQDWNQQVEQGRAGANHKGLIAVSFDQRNHGGRLVDKVANNAWRAGNPQHAQDMFSIVQGTAEDTSLLLTYLQSYVFPSEEKHITSHMVLGVSLGGHAAWQCLFHEPRITAGVVVIGCPDYHKLLSDRAKKSKRSSWGKNGSDFKGSEDWPRSFDSIVRQKDPSGICRSVLGIKDESDLKADVAGTYGDGRASELAKRLSNHMGQKRALNLAGGDDKLVPYSCAKDFMELLELGTKPGGWLSSARLDVKNMVFPGIGHTMSAGMLTEAVTFIRETLLRSKAKHTHHEGSKI